MSSALLVIDVQNVVVAGAQSAFCVDMAAKHALAEGFNVTLVSDGHANGDLNTSDGLITDRAVTGTYPRRRSASPVAR